MSTDWPRTRSGKIYNTMTEVTVTIPTALPQFSKANPRAWFRLAQARFASCALKTDNDKVNKVLEALPPDVFDKLAPWLETQPEDDTKYADLKAELLSYYTGSRTSRTEQILQLVNQPASELPSERWRQMDALQYNADGTKVDLLWELWLVSLPAQVRLHIDSPAKPTDIAAVIKKADSAQKQLSKEAAGSLPHGSQVMAAQPASNPKRSTHKGNQHRDEDRDKIIGGHCWYHRVFRHQARRCLEGCKRYVDIPKNLSGGQQ